MGGVGGGGGVGVGGGGGGGGLADAPCVCGVWGSQWGQWQGRRGTEQGSRTTLAQQGGSQDLLGGIHQGPFWYWVCLSGFSMARGKTSTPQYQAGTRISKTSRQAHFNSHNLGHKSCRGVHSAVCHPAQSHEPSWPSTSKTDIPAIHKSPT